MSGPPPPVADVRRAVREALADIEPGDLVLVACSGGADSLALAAAAVHEGEHAAWRVAAVTVDHGLQAGSPDRALAVATQLRALGLDPVEVATVRVGSGGGPEDAARRARHAALDEAADRLGAAAVLLGHTREDQAETVLLGLARGSGGRSLAGMAAVTGRVRRPLLRLSREVVRAAAVAEGLDPWEDPHNLDPAFARSRVRHDLLPALEDTLGPGVAAALARTADLLRADADALDAWTDRAWADARSGEGTSEEVALSVEVLEQLPSAVRTRVLRRAAVAAGSPSGSMTEGHVRSLDALVVGWRGQGASALPGGVSCRRDCGRLLLARDRAPHPTQPGDLRVTAERSEPGLL